MKKKQKYLTREESEQQFFDWLYNTNSTFKKDVDEHMSEIRWLTEEQVQIIREHSELNGKVGFGVNLLGETFIQLSDGIIQVTKKKK